MEKKKLICIVGPTASGKTGMGVTLAKKYNGEIVSADSRQVYRGLDIGTGKDLDEYGDIKYHLIDICEPGESFTMFDWLGRARKVLVDVWARGKMPIIVGGTGLYVQALVQGFEVTKKLKPKTQKCHCEKRFCDEAICSNEEYQREELEGKTKGELQKILIDLDKEAYQKVDLDNPYRLIRAIEKSQSGENVTKKTPAFDYILIGRQIPREELYSRIDRRVEEWFEEGFYEEVDGLLAGGVSPRWLNKIGLEYRILGKYISDRGHPEPTKSTGEGSSIIKGSLDSSQNMLVARDDILVTICVSAIQNDIKFMEMKQKMKYAIHQYARRQLTWWRRFDVEWVDDNKSAEEIVHKFLTVDR